MKKEMESNELVPKRRSLRGNFFLFVLAAMAVIGVGLWLLPVQMPARIRPAGEGRVYYHSSGLVNYEAVRKSPLTVPTEADPGDFFYRDSEKLYERVGRQAELRKAPAMDILPQVADSAVISREVLLELPPERLPEELPDSAENVSEDNMTEGKGAGL